jgi:hypothetical protein
MPPTDDDDKLLIRCPECRQRFKVQQDFLNRMVECGVCQHRFQIREDVIVRIRKFYPGEKRSYGLGRFQRIPFAPTLDEKLSASEAFDQNSAVNYFAPAPPQRIIAGFIGVLLILLVGLLMIFGTGHGGPLDGVDLTRKLVMCGFAGLLGFLLLLYANPNTRFAAAIFGGGFAIALVSLPFFIPDPLRPNESLDAVQLTSPEEAAAEPEATADELILKAMRERIGIRPLEQELERIASSDSPTSAYGLFLVGLQESNRIAVRDYMFRVTSADPSSHIYPRDDGKYLFVLSGLDMNLERLASLAAPLGSVRLIVPELQVAEILINNDVFIESPTEKLIDRAHPEFYELNLRELKSIDIQRIQRAATRIAEAEPRMLRADITTRLRELLEEAGVNFHGTVARALITWDVDRTGAAQLASQTVVRLKQQGYTPAVDLVSLAIEQPSDDLFPVMVALWQTNSLMWESHCIRIGPGIEASLLDAFETADASHKQSAARILAKVGGERSATTLRNAREKANREFEVIIDQALEQIAARIATQTAD